MGPDRSDDGLVPDDVEAALLARRVVVVTGEIDGARASSLAATLLTLDATGDGRVELRLQGCRGALDPALSVVDVIHVLGVPVHATALGTIEGGPIAVLAVASERHVAAHATLVLREADVTIAGGARDVERQLAAHAARRLQFLEVLARATRRPLAEVEVEWERGARLEAADAVALGYADAVLGAATGPARRGSD